MSYRLGRFVPVYILMVIILACIPLQVNASFDNLHFGPFSNKIVYNIISSEYEQVQALIDDEIDLIGDMLNPIYVNQLEEAENIEIVETPRNGYSILNINCQKYPFNYSSFRRAIAFALNKTGMCSDLWKGYALPLDCPVPRANPLSAEGLLDVSYYEADIERGNALLDEAGFIDMDHDGSREAPDGTDFQVCVEAPWERDTLLDILPYVVDALDALAIDNYPSSIDYHEYLLRIPSMKASYDMLVLDRNFINSETEWFAYDYWSVHAGDPYFNIPNWCNSTFDLWREQLIYDSDYDKIVEASIEMQKIWVEDCPAIVCCENTYLSAYRTDRFQGFLNSVQSGVPCWWTNYRVHLKEEYGGPYGGTLRWSNRLDLDTFNFMVSSSLYTWNVLQMLYDGLLKQDPEGNDLLWLAESFIVEANADNANVPEGHTRFTFDICQNATWSDGERLTGDDVAFSLNYYRDAPGNPYGASLSGMVAAYAPTPYRVVVEFSSESFWNLHSFGYKPIIPQHIFEVIGLDRWNIWDPRPPQNEMVTSGPYNVSDYVPGEFVELTYNPNYVYPEHAGQTLNPVTTLQPNFPTIVIPGIPITLSILDIAITIPSIVVVIVVLLKWKKDRAAYIIQ